MNEESGQHGKPLLMPKPGSVKVVRALYNYTAKYEDELSFSEGDVLYVFDRSDPEWWKARLGSKMGLIPSNHVEGKLDEVVNPLHEAARRGNLSFLKECLGQKVSSTGLDSMGNTPLYWASCSGHIDCVQYLLTQPNAPLNAQNHFGDTALHGAASKGHLDVVQMLLEAGCDPRVVNSNREKAAKLASTQEIKNILQNHESTEGTRICTRVTSEEYDDDSD